MVQVNPGDNARAGRAPDPATATAAANVASRLRDREIAIDGRETSEQLVDMLSAVEQFETAVAQLGGDNMNNAPDSADPEEPRFVLPRRRAGESAGDYTSRVREAADRLQPRTD